MLYIYFIYFSLVATFSGAGQLSKITSRSVNSEMPAIRDVGYFFALQQVPLSQKQYIFMADPLKRAVYIIDGQTIPLNYTMTEKNARGFDMYFSATDYSIILSVKEDKVIDGKTNEYQGNLLIRHGREKRRYAVHGIYNR